MSVTYQVSDGDLYIDRDTGRLIPIQDEVKLGQDLAMCLLEDFDASRDFGSELQILDIPTASAANGYIAQLVSEAVTRLQAYQRKDTNTSQAEMIQSIQTIRVAIDKDNQSEAYFYLIVANELGTEYSSVMRLSRPTSLNHQLNPNAALEVIKLEQITAQALSGGV